MSRPNLQKIMTISTGHVSDNTLKLLADTVIHYNLNFMVIPKHKYGFIIYVPQHIDNNMPDDLAQITQYCYRYGCDILCLDSTGPHISDLNWYGDKYTDNDSERFESIIQTERT